VALADVTADRHLPGVRRVLRNCTEVAPLVYKPGRRWVARTASAGQGPQLVKAYDPATVPLVLAGHRALSGLPVPGPRQVLRRAGVVVTPWVPGASLDTLGGQVPALWSRAGELLARVHAQPRTGGLEQV